MNDSNLPPEQWRPLFDTAGIEFGYRPLANRIGMNHTRVRRVLRGSGTTSGAIQQVADALRVPAAKVRELRGDPASEYEPFILPDDAGRLNDKERDAIRAVVRVLLNAKDAHDADEPTATTDSAPQPPTQAKGVKGKEVPRRTLDLAARIVDDEKPE